VTALSTHAGTGPPAAPPAADGRAARRPRTGRRIALLVIPATVFVALAFLVPMVRLGWLSVTSPAPGLGNYAKIFSDGISLPIMGRTLRMAVTVTVVTLLCGYPYAYLMTVVSARWRAVLLAIVLMPFWTSLMARNFAWVVLFQDNGPLHSALRVIGLGSVHPLGTATGVTIAMAQVMLPFMVLPLYSNLKGIDRRLMPAALSLGARPIVAFGRVYLPLSLPGMAAGTTMVLILSLGFYITPALVGSPQQSMIAQLIASKVQQVLDFGGGGALSFALLVVAVVLLALVGRVARPTTMIAGSGES
jgi:putative spermidine/putrescine transport system permease protein